MIQPESEHERRCRPAVDQLLARHGWQLMPAEELVRRSAEHLRDGVTADAYRAAIYTYSHALYSACSGGEGAEHQNLGYTELYRYLYTAARVRYSGIHEEAAQFAVEAVFIAFARCRQPGAFLAFALQHLMDAARAIYRQEARQPESLFARGVHEAGSDELLADHRLPDVDEVVLASEERTQMAQVVAGYLRKHPRARQQLAALILKYVEGLDDQTISRLLDKPVASVYVLRARALDRLRLDPEWQALAAEFGLMPDMV